jgi:hypothetical protein
MPRITVAPVVVSPDRDSKMESVTDRSGSGESQNGQRAGQPEPTQNSTTTRKPSRRRSSCRAVRPAAR